MPSGTAERDLPIRELLKRLPTNLLDQISSVLEASHDQGLDCILDQVEYEKHQRCWRDAIFSSYLPLFLKPDQIHPFALFPHELLEKLWQSLAQSEALALQSVLFGQTPLPHQCLHPAWFGLIERAGRLCRDRPQSVVSDYAGAFNLGIVVELGTFLELHPLIRKALLCLPHLAGRLDGDVTRQLRDLVKEADATVRGGGVRLITALFAHLDDRVTMTKVIAAICEHNHERFLATSPFADLIVHLILDLEIRLTRSRQALTGLGRCDEQRNLLGSSLVKCMEDLHALDTYFELEPYGQWKKRLTEARLLTLALVGEACEMSRVAIDSVLILKKTIARQGRPGVTIAFDITPGEADVQRAKWTMALIRKLRSVSTVGGFDASLCRTVAVLEAKLEGYLSELIVIRAQDKTIKGLDYYLENVASLLEALFDKEEVLAVWERSRSSAGLSLGEDLSFSSQVSASAQDLLAKAGRRQLRRFALA